MTTIQKISTPVATKVIESTNILFRLQELVCRINAQLSRLSQETQSRSQTMKKEYRVNTDKSANLTKIAGGWAPCISGAALAASGIGILANARFGQDAVKPWETTFGLIPNLVRGGGEWITSGLNAEISQANSVSSLRQTEISNEAQKSGEARDLQSELQQLLGNIRELFKKASS